MEQPHSLDTAADFADVACNLCGSTRCEPLFTKRGYRLVECGNCQLAYIANPPDAEGIKAIYTATSSYHDQLLDTGSAQSSRQRLVARQHMEMLVKFRPRLEGLRVLDIGCSSGIFLDEARAAGMVPFGAELSPETAAFARDHFGLEVHQGDWRDAGYAEASFDVITLFDVIEHLPDPLGELRAIQSPAQTRRTAAAIDARYRRTLSAPVAEIGQPARLLASPGAAAPPVPVLPSHAVGDGRESWVRRRGRAPHLHRSRV